MPVPSLSSLSTKVLLEATQSGRSGPIISESAENVLKKANIDVDQGVLSVLNRQLDQESIKRLGNNSSIGVRQLNINNAIRSGSGEKPRRAILAASQLLTKETQAYSFREAVSANVSSENAKLALYEASKAKLTTNDIGQIFYRAVSHPDKNVQICALDLLKDVVPLEGYGIGTIQQVLIKAAKSPYDEVKDKVRELLPDLLKEHESTGQMVLKELGNKT